MFTYWKLDILRKSVLHNVIDAFNIIPIGLFPETDKLIPKFTEQCKDLQSQNNLKREQYCKIYTL